MTVEIHLVPGHMSVEWNERADEAAKMAPEKRGIREYPERFTSLTHIRRSVTETKWKEAKNWFRSRYEGRAHIERAQYGQVLETQ